MQFNTDKKPLTPTTQAFAFSTAKSVSSFKMLLNWDGKQDVDLSLFGLKSDGKIDENLFGYVFFYFWPEQVKNGNNVSAIIKVNPDKSYETLDGALKHSADVRDGSKQADDEWSIFTPAKVAASIEKIAIVASIYGNESFGLVQNAIFAIQNAETGETIQNYELTKNFGNAKIIVIGELVKKSSGWEFQPLGDTHTEANLDAALKAYGVPM